MYKFNGMSHTAKKRKNVCYKVNGHTQGQIFTILINNIFGISKMEEKSDTQIKFNNTRKV